jgi:hypothetical protein
VSPAARRTNAERLRLLGLRRAVHFTVAVPSTAVRPPVAVIEAGTTPKVKAS